jgi:hypothetical protein
MENRSQDNAVSIVTGCGLDWNRAELKSWQDFSPVYIIQTHPASYPVATEGQGMKLTTHLQLVPRSKIWGAMPPLPCVFMA